MRILGTRQFLDKKYKTLPLDAGSPWALTLGNLEQNFVGIVYGYSGNGKTEFCVRMMKQLCEFDKCAWLSYEQGHSLSLQRAVDRANLKHTRNPISWVDPVKKSKGKIENTGSYFEQLDEYLSKRSTPRYVFIDSVNYTRITVPEFYYLKERHGGRKGIVFIGHTADPSKKTPDTPTGRKIEFDGDFGILVKDFIATPRKNRFSAYEPFIVWEEKARQRNPFFFAMRENLMRADGKPIKEPKIRKKRTAKKPKITEVEDE